MCQAKCRFPKAKFSAGSTKRTFSMLTPTGRESSPSTSLDKGVVISGDGTSLGIGLLHTRSEYALTTLNRLCASQRGWAARNPRRVASVRLVTRRAKTFSDGRLSFVSELKWKISSPVQPFLKVLYEGLSNSWISKSNGKQSASEDETWRD